MVLTGFGEGTREFREALRLPVASDRRRDWALAALASSLLLAAYAAWAAQPAGPAVGDSAWTRAAVDVVHVHINP